MIEALDWLGNVIRFSPARVLCAVCVPLLLLSRAPLAAAQTGQATVSGVVQDQTGAVLPGAPVQLVQLVQPSRSGPPAQAGRSAAAAETVQTADADSSGAFRFERVAPGNYELRAAFEGFKPASIRVRVGARPVSSLKLVLEVAGLTQEITVSSAGQVEATSAANLDAVAVDQKMLEGLPVFDQDYIATLSRFLDSGSLGTNGATIVVNGMEVSALRVSASAVQQIKINQDPYSAEYARPGRGRIEILTKPGGREYHGEANLIGRDAQFDARNAFTTTKPAERKTIVEGIFGGPVGGGGKTSFLLSAHDQKDDQQALIFAIGPTGTIEDAVPQPNRQSLVSFSLTRQQSDATTISIRPSYEYESNENRGVGGVTLATAGTNFTHNEQQVSFTHQTIISPTLLNQFQVLVGHEREPTVSVSPSRGIVVAGAFTGGGGQGDLLRTETHMQLTESLGWTKGKHLVQAGFQLPDWSRRGFYDRTNFGGTFYFSGLDTYSFGLPYAFIQQQGNGDVAFLEKQVGTYVKDDWQVRPGLSLSVGLRYDWQNYFHDNNNFAPRASVAYSPGNSKTNVIRAGVGVFNDRSGPVVIADLLHYQPGGLTRFVVSNPSYPNPALSSSGTADAPSIVRLAPDVQIPQTLQYSVGLDHQLRQALTLSVGYTGARGYNMFRSRDINAPLPPFYAARPDPAYSVVREIESNGRQQSDSVQVTVRGRMSRWFNGQTQYTWSRVYNDTNGITAFPANDYDLSGEWARADFDRRHRFLVLGRVTPGKVADFGVGVTMNSAGPYTELLGPDVYNNGRGRARPPGVPRNSLEAAGYASLDLRASRDFTLAGTAKDGRVLTVGLDAFNVLNRVNYATFVGTVGSPLFGQPISARTPRQLQFSARIRF
ncbi:MAG TPA: carboxypeptidase regulatory-like domain-containing protein [Vicinamibacterales bacterium]|nr:carboxypeptidase regulatory-like domain-containing protein [Vicinamibacterales bacterium]